MSRPHRVPPFHALAAFESAARLGGFALAAAELCVTPSAVSHRIRLLEAHVGEPLFDRSAKGVRLSDAGRRYLDGVREAFEKLALLSQKDDVAPMRLRVGAPPTFTRNLLIPRLPEFYREWPDIEIEVAIAAPMDRRPERHDIDIRFGDGRFDDRHASKLFDDTVVVLAAPAYPLEHGLRAPQDLSRAHLLRSPLVPWRPWFVAAGCDWPEPRRGLSFSDLGILLEAAASGLGVAVSTRRVAQGWTRDSLLAPLFGIEAPSDNSYHALVDHAHLSRPEVVAFLDWLRGTFA